jgi:hypothetical protein
LLGAQRKAGLILARIAYRREAKALVCLSMLDRYLFIRLLKGQLALTLVLAVVIWLVQALDLFDKTYFYFGARFADYRFVANGAAAARI